MTTVDEWNKMMKLYIERWNFIRDKADDLSRSCEGPRDNALCTFRTLEGVAQMSVRDPSIDPRAVAHAVKYAKIASEAYRNVRKCLHEAHVVPDRWSDKEIVDGSWLAPPVCDPVPPHQADALLRK